ncbi:response regulator [Denitratimonas sp. CY0512]|uniref:response regulator n=1 Tax=Denitratimonas sp. CY0512 TaxID=3131940 RepID=UPI0030B5831F
MYRVLLLDDEPNILRALRRCLTAISPQRLDGDPLEIDAFSSPTDALRSCEEATFDLILTDYRMPRMDGVEFLTRVIPLQPDAPRVIISGFADRDAIIAAINDAQLTRFIEKPWDDGALQEAVVTILTRGKVQAVQAFARSAASERERQRLEEECPGITTIDRDPDGGIWLDLDEVKD